MQQRSFARAAIDFPVTVILPGDELVLEGRAIDVSGGGMRVAAASDLAPGQDVALRFTLPAQSNEVRVRGRVVTSFFDAASGKFAHGVAFTKYAQPDRDAIVAFVDARSKDKSR
jgi:c-di-GMP-binding flagellar brake protein YcgR